jgi:hypothetical protein
MRRIFGVVAWGILGAVLAAALIGGAFVLAGTSLTEPASAVRVTTGPPLRPDTSNRHETEPAPVANGTPPTGSTPAPPDDAPSLSTGTVRAPNSEVSTPSEDGGGPERGDD